MGDDRVARPVVSAVIVSYNTRDLTAEAVQSVLGAGDGLPREVIVVDNASTDGSAGFLAGLFPTVRVLRMDENIGYGRANNEGFAVAGGDFVLLLNSDAVLRGTEDLSRMVQIMNEEPDIGILGPRLENPGGVLERSARPFPGIAREFVQRTGLYRLLPRKVRAGWLLGSHWDHAQTRDVDWLTGACLLVRRKVIQGVGGFDPTIFMYGEELEWSYRVTRAGWRVVYDPRVTVDHRRAASSVGRDDWRVRMAHHGDRHFLRTHRSALGRLGFGLSRWIGLAVEWVEFGLLAVVSGSEYHRSRRNQAATELRSWTAWWSGADRTGEGS